MSPFFVATLCCWTGCTYRISALMVFLRHYFKVKVVHVIETVQHFCEIGGLIPCATEWENLSKNLFFRETAILANNEVGNCLKVMKRKQIPGRSGLEEFAGVCSFFCLRWQCQGKFTLLVLMGPLSSVHGTVYSSIVIASPYDILFILLLSIFDSDVLYL